MPACAIWLLGIGWQVVGVIQLAILHEGGHALVDQAVGLGKLAVDRGSVGGVEVGRAGEQLAEVAGAHPHRRHRDEVGVDRLHFAEGLVVAKGKELVLEDRTADGEARLVAVEGGIRARRSIEQLVAGIGVEVAAAIELRTRSHGSCWCRS